jgi:hypothetical protein
MYKDLYAKAKNMPGPLSLLSNNKMTQLLVFSQTLRVSLVGEYAIFMPHRSNAVGVSK